jgi:hypothetical protein
MSPLDLAKANRSVAQALLDHARRRAQQLDATLAAKLATAIVMGQEEVVSALRPAVAPVLGQEPWLRLLAFDADRIGDYVFASSRPPIVLGGSRALEAINEEVDSSRITNAWPIYSAGGGGLLVQAESASATDAAKALAGLFESRTHAGLSVTVVDLPVTVADLLPAAKGPGLPATLRRMAEQLRVRKDMELPADDLLPAPDDPLCDSCQQRAPAVQWEAADRSLQLCLACDARRKEGQSYILGTDFQTIANCGFGAARDGLCLLALDGNGMGELLEQLTTLAQVRAFSEATATVMQQARDRAVASVEEQACISLLSGGDEIVLVMPGGGAFEVADRILSDVAAGFAAMRQDSVLVDVFRNNPAVLERLAATTVGIGMVIAPPKLPVRQLHAYAMALQKSAKRSCYYGRSIAERRSGIDFACLNDGSALPLGVRSIEQGVIRTGRSRLLRTSRPFDARSFGQALAASQGLARLAKSQVQALRERCEDGAAVATSHVCYQIARDRRDRLGWVQWFEHCGVDSGKREAIAQWLFPQAGEHRSALFLDLVEMNRWVGGMS